MKIRELSIGEKQTTLQLREKVKSIGAIAQKQTEQFLNVLKKK